MRILRNLFLPIMAMTLLGCWGKVPQNRYYLLDYVPTPNATRTTDYNLRVKTLNVAEAYRRPEIVYRQSAHELLFYNYHQWAVKPEHLVTNMVVKHMRSSKIFKGVSESLLDFDPDYTLMGQILAIEEYDNQEKWYAHLAVNFQLEDKRKKIVWQKTYDVRKVVAQQEPVYVVRELSFLLENILDKMITEFEIILPKSNSPLNNSSLTPINDEKSKVIEQEEETQEIKDSSEKPKTESKEKSSEGKNPKDQD